MGPDVCAITLTCFSRLVGPTLYASPDAAEAATLSSASDSDSMPELEEGSADGDDN